MGSHAVSAIPTIVAPTILRVKGKSKKVEKRVICRSLVDYVLGAGNVHAVKGRVFGVIHAKISQH